MFTPTLIFVPFSILLLAFSIGSAKDTKCKPESDSKCWVLQNKQSRIVPNSECTIERPGDNWTDIDDKPLVIDPCTDEENRNFMECVLNFDPNIAAADPGYNKGTCQCYRSWSAEVGKGPAYNHSVNVETQSEEWFLWDKEFQECVVKDKKQCAPADVVLIPYRCERKKNRAGKVRRGRCAKLDEDPKFKVCSVDGADQNYPPFKLLTMVMVSHLLYFGV